ncbi:MAG TPA: L,D-transpeptidase [Solirubrobacteraceae bacterium]|nr:L,D-transpeptidase [Solirubrobacteraceae bacterium]
MRPRLSALLLGASLAGLLCVLPSSALAGSGRARVRATQQLAVLLSAHRAHESPLAGSRVLASVPDLRPITGERTTLPVIGHARGRDGIPWLRVLLPGRPNGEAGWIAAQGTRASVTGWRLRVSLGERRVRVYRGGRLLRSFGAVVGKPSTPTPTGRFFVEETLQMSPGEPGGPFALALSARSDALQEFEGGPGQIALHGRDNLGGVLGQAESHGCMRLATASIDWLARRIGPGVPVTIDAR